jgi:hypothetical protein
VAFCWPAVSKLFFNAAKMSTIWPVRRGAGETALISWPSTFFSMPPLNDRLLFDFPHNVAGLFIVSQSDKVECRR